MTLFQPGGVEDISRWREPPEHWGKIDAPLRGAGISVRVELRRPAGADILVA